MENLSRISAERTFPRYRTDLALDLVDSGTLRKGRLVDFTPSGMGVLIENTERINSKVLKIRINAFGFDTCGKIVWASENKGVIRAGINIPGLLKGDLGLYPLPCILSGIFKDAMTGRLSISDGTIHRNIYFRNGSIIFADSSDPDESLAKLLFDSRKLGAEEYCKIVKDSKQSGRLHAAILVESGYIKAGELMPALQFAVKKIVMKLFLLNKGGFHFSDSEDALNEAVKLRINTRDIIYTGSRTLQDPEIIRRSSPPWEAAVRISTEPSDLVKNITIHEEDGKLLKMMSSKRTVAELVASSGSGELKTLRTIAAFCNAGIASIVDYGIEHLSKDSDHQRMAGKEKDLIDRINEIHLKFSSSSSLQVLDVSENAAPHEIKQANLRIIKEYHPDKYAHLGSESLQKKLSAIFSLISEAYRDLSRSAIPATQSVMPEEVITGDEEPPESTVSDCGTTRLAQQRFIDGLNAMQRGNFDEASILFGQAVYLNGSEPDYHYYYGLSLIKVDKIKLAEKSILKALQLDPENSKYLTQLGHIYLNLGFKARARTNFEKALRIDASDSNALRGVNKLS